MGAPTVSQWLEKTAARHSSYGGGSAAALSCALAAALVEKLAVGRGAAATARRLRLCCTKLIDADANVFSRFLRAYQQGNRAAARLALKAATDIPSQVEECSTQVLEAARRIRPHVGPRYRVDLRCAERLARAAQQSARALVAANRAWAQQLVASRKP